MKEINDEIKLTLDLMQTDIDDGAHSELRYHLLCLMEIKREQLAAETGLQDELERLVGALEKIADLELPGTDGATEFSRSQDRWRKLLEAQGIAESAIAQYRKEHTKEH